MHPKHGGLTLNLGIRRRRIGTKIYGLTLYAEMYIIENRERINPSSSTLMLLNSLISQHIRHWTEHTMYQTHEWNEWTPPLAEAKRGIHYTHNNTNTPLLMLMPRLRSPGKDNNLRSWLAYTRYSRQASHQLI